MAVLTLYLKCYKGSFCDKLDKALEPLGRQMVEKWGHHCDQYMFPEEKDLSGIEEPLAPKYLH